MYADNNGSMLPSGVRPQFSSLSPYLDFDPAYVKRATQPEFILPEGAGEKRGRFELSFLKIGSSCMIGALVGGVNGLYQGLKATTLEGQTGKLKRTTIFNHVMKKGAASANTLGVVAVLYSSFGVFFEKTRGCENDELNTIAAASVTGMLFKSTSGLRKCALGGAVGFSLAAAYCFWTSRDKLQDLGNRSLKT